MSQETRMSETYKSPCVTHTVESLVDIENVAQTRAPPCVAQPLVLSPPICQCPQVVSDCRHNSMSQLITSISMSQSMPCSIKSFSTCSALLTRPNRFDPANAAASTAVPASPPSPPETCPGSRLCCIRSTISTVCVSVYYFIRKKQKKDLAQERLSH